MRFTRVLFLLGLVFPCLIVCRLAQASEVAQPDGSDVLVFINGDQLTGTLVRSIGDSVIFRSSMAGELTVSWSKIKDLRSPHEFVVLMKDQKLDHKAVRHIKSGTLTADHDTIDLNGKGGKAEILVARAANVIDKQVFEKQALKEPGFFHNWSGAANLGALAVLATQDTYSVNGGVNLVRESPGVDYLPARNRTLVNYSSSYSTITQRQWPEAPPLPDLKISILHADAEYDQYISPKVYVLGQTAFDHNFGQGLDLQQIYGGGVGMTVVKRPSQTLDVRATLQYEKQKFTYAVAFQDDRNLIGSTFSATYVLKLPHSMVFRQDVQYLPAYNLRYAYSYGERNSLVIPVYKRLGLQLGTADTYLNNPPPATYPAAVNRPNSLQFTTGVSLSLK